METKVLLCNGMIVSSYRTTEQKLQALDDYMRLYGLDVTAFECRTEMAQICVGLAKHENVQYDLYTEQKAHIFRNFRRGLLTSLQMESSLTQIQKDWFAEWQKNDFMDNICELTAELLSDKENANIEIEED